MAVGYVGVVVAMESDGLGRPQRIVVMGGGGGGGPRELLWWGERVEDKAVLEVWLLLLINTSGGINNSVTVWQQSGIG